MRFPEFSGEWESVTLDKIVSRVTRKNKGNASRLPLTISAQYGLVDQISYFNKVVASTDMSNYYLLRNGEFAYNKSYSGDYPWGAIKRLDRYDEGALSSLYICFFPNEKIDSDYLVHYFESSKWYREISNIAGEGARNHGLLNIAVNDFFTTKHWIAPSKAEQKKISALLNLIEERITTQRKIIEELKKLKSTIMVRHYHNSSKASFKISELGEPFNVMNLSKDDLSSDGVPCILYGELFTTYGCVVNNVVSKTHKSDNVTLSQIGDLLFPASTTVDALSLISPSSINQNGVVLGGDMFGIHIDKCFNNDYLSYYFNIIAKNKIAKYAKGSTIIHLHYQDIKNVSVNLPSKIEQDHIVKVLQKVEAKATTEENLYNILLRQKMYLLSQMFT